MFKYSDNYRIALLFLLSIFFITACSVRSVQIKRAEEYYKKGQYLVSKGETDRAITFFNKSMSMARGVEYKAGIVFNLNELAIIHTNRGEYIEARILLSEIIQICKDLHMDADVSKALNNMAATYVKEKNYQEAVKRFEELLEWDKKTGNDAGVGITLYNMALMYHRIPNMKEKSKACFFEALEVFEKTGNEKYIRMIRKNIEKGH